MIENPMDMYNPYFTTANINNTTSIGGSEIVLDYTGLTPLPKDPTVTMGYIPFQTKSRLYSEDKALKVGTLFEALDKPFLGGSAR